ncbi:MAG: transcriptional regulator PpsR [Pseudomonadota bacterium]
MKTSGSSFWTSGAIPLVEPEFLSSIIAAASDLALVVSSDARILSVVISSGDDSMGNLTHWEGRPIAEFLTEESIEKFEVAHAAYMAGNPPKAPLEVTHSDNAVWHHPVRYTFHQIGVDDAALMLGRDLRPIAETQQQLVQAQIALEQGFEARREFDLRYRIILSNTADAVVFVALQTGRIEDGNQVAADMLGMSVDAMVGTSFGTLFEGAGEIAERLAQATMADPPEPLELTAARTKTRLQVTPKVFRAGGQRVALCKLVSTQAVAADISATDRNVLTLFRRGVDAMLFADSSGQIMAVNEAFLDLSGVPQSADVVGKSLGAFLVRGQVDLNVLLENAARSGRMRLYATKLINELGTRLPVEVSATRLGDDPEAPIALILRDVSQAETVRSTPPSGGAIPDPSRNVVELVGSASLKDIVAETTDVVEKMCIETAVALTRNNRVAAADMLGLSRQSLYVKLRKYGLLSKN